MEWYQWVGIGFLVFVIVMQRFSMSDYQSMIESRNKTIDEKYKLVMELRDHMDESVDCYLKTIAKLQSAARINESTISGHYATIKNLQTKIRELEQSHIAERDDRLADMTKQRDNLAELVQRLRDKIKEQDDRLVKYMYQQSNDLKKITDLDYRHLEDMAKINEQAATIVELESQLAATSKTCHEYNDKLSEVHSRLCGIVSELQS